MWAFNQYQQNNTRTKLNGGFFVTFFGCVCAAQVHRIVCIEHCELKAWLSSIGTKETKQKNTEYNWKVIIIIIVEARTIYRTAMIQFHGIVLFSEIDVCEMIQSPFHIQNAPSINSVHVHSFTWHEHSHFSVCLRFAGRFFLLFYSFAIGALSNVVFRLVFFLFRFVSFRFVSGRFVRSRKINIWNQSSSQKADWVVVHLCMCDSYTHPHNQEIKNCPVGFKCESIPYACFVRSFVHFLISRFVQCQRNEPSQFCVVGKKESNAYVQQLETLHLQYTNRKNIPSI